MMVHTLSRTRTALLAAAVAAGMFALGAGRAPSLAATSNPSDLDRSMLDYSFLRAGSEFYKQVDDQTLLDGAVAGIKKTIQSKGGDATHVQPLKAMGSKSADLSLLNQELQAADIAYGKTVGERQIAYGAIAGILDSLHDHWTVFMTPDEYKSLNQNLEGGGFPGIGIVIDTDPDSKSLLVTQVIAGGPADKAGLQPGDIVLTIDGKTTQGLSVSDDSKLIRGKPGTSVELVVQRKGQTSTLTMNITREFIHEPSVLSRVLENNVGYVRLLVFGATTGEELTKALDDFQKAGVKGYVLDLRYNGGGYLNAAVDVASKFIPDGPIVSIDGRQKPFTTINAEATAVDVRPLAVLVNGYTASASEITAGAVQDDGAGVLIGTKTYGKGEVQTIYPLPDGSAIKITTARYLTPSGKDINTIGIKPDIEVADVKPADIGNVLNDTQLQRALAFIHDQIAAGNSPSGAPGASSGTGSTPAAGQ
ncbi:MAG: S41 family peptidase [Candidatus Eremiobacteraeota bacterium]|nr:S41 family peptidase [Candidatus Eremiobacteraeota bacterium]MBV8222208.1 S41 family peptidase [Candidatus Eremiobacteraeota bacterium]